MAVPTVASLCARLGADLRPAEGFRPPHNEISAVHISELRDPTAYLNGGELLLTLGLSLPSEDSGCDEYAARLKRAGVTALAIGLGPVHATVPARLAAACARADLCLLQVPAPTPFLTITKAYWSTVTQTVERQLTDTLASHRALVDAAASRDPVPAVLRTLARTFDGWAAVLDRAGRTEHVFPAGMLENAESLRSEVTRLRGAGVHAAATFSIHDHNVLLHPLAVEDRVVGYLAVGSSSRLDATARRIALTGSALLSIEAVHRQRSRSAGEPSRSAVAALVGLGQVAAARSLAAHLGAPPVQDRSRVLVIASSRCGDALDAVEGWCEGVHAVLLDPQHAWFLVPPDHPPADRLGAALADVDPAARAELSPLVAVDHIARLRGQMIRRIDDLSAGTRLLAHVPEEGLDPGGLAEELEALLAYRGGHLVAALAAYLRHRGQWEQAARALDVHRNTLRHRIDRCGQVMGVDLEDPDLTARLWLLLRRRGLA